MADNVFRGLGIALITPMKGKDAEVDYDALERLVAYQVSNGADFLCILATTAEAPCLTREEKRRITEVIRATVNGRIPLLSYCGGNNTRAVIDEMLATDWTGVDGLLSVCPYYNKPSQEGLYQHFSAIAAKSPLPIVLYNVPGRTGVNLQARTTLRLAHHCPNIVGVKEASGNLEQVEEIIRQKPDGFNVLSGDDSLTLPMIAEGAVGAISVVGNALPEVTSRLIHSAMAGDYDHARELNDRLAELYSLLFVDGNPAGVKGLLSAKGMVENVLRLPLVPAREETIEKMKEIDFI